MPGVWCALPPFWLDHERWRANQAVVDVADAAHVAYDAFHARAKRAVQLLHILGPPGLHSVYRATALSEMGHGQSASRR